MEPIKVMLNKSVTTTIFNMLSFFMIQSPLQSLHMLTNCRTPHHIVQIGFPRHNPSAPYFQYPPLSARVQCRD
ncbi:hypothetical protein PAECIP111893_05323 [Paenibacillus plantiphilus]|uniref:Uncharacterized protein n=1 Tax=Paenibacillus plantiphilus TaxID=2905650 RepID=A0ABM9CWH7_9BACL|nr:hypothetical protein PAECIP111893_05323 [Paenibacillus plantiphilus]